MFSTKKSRSKLAKKLQGQGWDVFESECAAITVFPMESNPGHRGLENYLRTRSREMARVVGKGSGFDRATAQQLVADALEAYAGACSEAGSVSYGMPFARRAAELETVLVNRAELEAVDGQKTERISQILEDIRQNH